ncbi:MAG TPA: uroporphyrinogen-III synthase [Burkholderiaceae bacterium]|nr:uroporphyrinogen-III synthase [Burkholderiaceae bacterium]
MAANTVVIVTRPGAAGQSLTQALTQAQLEAVWWPAFAMDVRADAAAAEAFAHLSAYDCVVFVSPYAVVGVAALLRAPWPPSVALAAVGSGTAQAIRKHIVLNATHRLIEPAADSDAMDQEVRSGSEPLWAVLKVHSPKRVLIARAQRGRDWLAQKLRQAGAVVDDACVYQRHPLPLTVEHAQRIIAWAQSGATLITVFTSSEAVSVTLDKEPSPGVDIGDILRRAQTILRGQPAVATHPRIARQLTRCGASHVSVLPGTPVSLINFVNTLSVSTS